MSHTPGGPGAPCFPGMPGGPVWPGRPGDPASPSPSWPGGPWRPNIMKAKNQDITGMKSYIVLISKYKIWQFSGVMNLAQIQGYGNTVIIMNILSSKFSLQLVFYKVIKYIDSKYFSFSTSSKTSWKCSSVGKNYYGISIHPIQGRRTMEYSRLIYKPIHSWMLEPENTWKYVWQCRASAIFGAVCVALITCKSLNIIAHLMAQVDPEIQRALRP